jgi:hypothetical protein
VSIYKRSTDTVLEFTHNYCQYQKDKDYVQVYRLLTAWDNRQPSISLYGCQIVDIPADGYNLTISDLGRQFSPPRGLLSRNYVPFFSFTSFLNLAPIPVHRAQCTVFSGR